MSPEEIQMRRAEIEARKTDEGYANSPAAAEDAAWLAELEEVKAVQAASDIIDDPEAAVEKVPVLRGKNKHSGIMDEVSWYPHGEKPQPKPKTHAEIKAAKKSSTTMPSPYKETPKFELPRQMTLPGKFQKEYERAQKLSRVDELGKKMFATPTVDPRRKELDAERKRATDMVNLVQQILDQRAQLAIALANVSSTVMLKERREEDLQHMAGLAASMSKTIVENLTDYDLQSYTLIAGLNNLKDDQSLRRAGHHTRERVLELTKVAASMLADARFRIEQIRTAGRAAIAQRDEALKRVAELTGEEYKPEEPPKQSVN